MRYVTLLLSAMSLRAELIDRVAVSIGTTVITESELVEQLRIRAFLEGVPLRLDGESKRDAADRLIQQSLIRREVTTTRYAQPDAAAVEPLVAALKANRFGSNDAQYQQALTKALVTDKEVRASLLWQLTVLRFIEFRFRPGIQVSQDDVRDYYERRFLPDWRAKTNDPPPSAEEAERTVEELLVQDRIDNQLDRWISMSRTQVSIRYREEVFEGL
jgi:peptidyl-prolyl cis-trans isomerase SurA